MSNASRSSHPAPGKIAVAEPLQCPTLLENGFGSHRIEGIGDKHVPWIHNARNTDMVIAVDDEAVVRLARLFNEPAGRMRLAAVGVPEAWLARLDLLGFSGICNLIAAVKFARYYGLGAHDVVLTVLTDSMQLYGSRLAELRAQAGDYSAGDAAADCARYLQGIGTDETLELDRRARRRIHNLKYFTWVEQRGRSCAELEAQWHDPACWEACRRQAGEIDALIEEFNARIAAG